MWHQLAASELVVDEHPTPFVVIDHHNQAIEVSCSDCKQNPPPEGFFPKYGIAEKEKPKPRKEVLERGQNDELASADNLLSMLIDKIPDERVKQGLKEYQKIVNPKAYNGGSSVGQSNKGIVFYYEDRFRRNQCFRKAAIDFYGSSGFCVGKNRSFSTSIV